MKKNIVWIIAIILFIIGIFWIILNQSRNTKNTSVPSITLRATMNHLAPEVYFSDIAGNTLKLSDFRGRKLMLWSVATWCSSCSEGAHILAKNEAKLGKLTILVLKSYGNAGYPGPKIERFASQSAPNMLTAKNWLWGNFSSQATQIYNPRNYPDIYFLIDKQGIIRDINDAPAATINTIVKFANN